VLLSQYSPHLLNFLTSTYLTNSIVASEVSPARQKRERKKKEKVFNFHENRKE
jgi:hypothetical protein